MHDDTQRTTRYRDMTPLSSSLVGQRVTHNPQRNRLIETLGKYRFKSALEIGCNVGACIGRVKSELIPEGYCAGIDFNVPSVEHAPERNPGVDYRAMDAEDICEHFEPGQFDLIFTVACLMHCGADLWQAVCGNILRLEPKLILHHEPQGEERLIRELPLGRIWRASKYSESPLPDRSDDEIVYFQRYHNYICYYAQEGRFPLNISYNPEELSQCAEVVVVLDDNVRRQA